MTHESFLAATVLKEDGNTARAILRGVTESHERHYFTRIQHYKPPDSTSRGLPTVKQLQKERRPTTAQWQELHQILVRQPSVVQVRTDITEEVLNALSRSQGGEAPPVIIPAGKPCSLRWADMPDPPSPQRPLFIAQRRLVDIDDPRAPAILAENSFRPTSDLIEESYCWWSEGVEYSLTRMFVVALKTDHIVSTQVPNPAGLTSVGNIWILYVRAKVDSSPTTTMPERVRQAQAQLVRVREQLKGVFDFPAFDRRCHDTRVPYSKAG